VFLSKPPDSEKRSALYARDRADDGYVANLTRLWAWRPDIYDAFAKLRALVTDPSALSMRDRATLVCATAATVCDSYCALAWGTRLAAETDANTAALVLQRKEAPERTARENALAMWAQKVMREPNAITADDVEALRSVGIADQEIFSATAFVALRLAFSTVNDALGARPDRELAASAPAVVRNAVVYGRSVAEVSAE